MALRLPFSQVIIPMYPISRRAFLKALQKDIDSLFEEIPYEEALLIASLLFPVDAPWFPKNQMKTRFKKAKETFEDNEESYLFYKENLDLVNKMIKDWNALAYATPTVLFRKFEGIGVLPSFELVKIIPLGRYMIPFIGFCQKFSNNNVEQVIRETISKMKDSSWSGKLTPKVAIALVTIKSENNYNLSTNVFAERTFGS